MQITLIRHLPTEWNKKEILQGRKNISISDITTEHQARIMKNKLLLQENAPYDLVLASSLRRTQQTAKQYDFEPLVETLLDELDFGIYEGNPRQKLLDHFGKQWMENPETIRLGESLLTLEERIAAFLKKYLSYKNILLFGHGAWIRAFLSYVHNGNLSDMNKRKVRFNDPVIMNINNAKKITY